MFRAEGKILGPRFLRAVAYYSSTVLIVLLPCSYTAVGNLWHVLIFPVVRCAARNPGFFVRCCWGIEQGVYSGGKRVPPFLRREDDHVCGNGDDF